MDELRANKEKSPQTDQQATNAALAALAAAGNSFALGQLWEINKGFVRRQLWQWYENNKPVADNAGLSFEDLVQEGYFAVDYAAKHYSAEQGSFTTYLSYALLAQIRKATCGEHVRNVTTQDGKRVAISANPLNECSSLDVRLDESDEGSSTKGETIEDPAASQAFQSAEDSIYTEELHAALEEALSKLPPRYAEILRLRYYEGKTLQETGEQLGVQRTRVQQIEAKSFRTLRTDSQLARWRDEIISTRAWRGTGFGAWSYSGSVEERTVEYIEQLEARREESAKQEAASREEENRRRWQEYFAKLDAERKAREERYEAEYRAHLEQLKKECAARRTG